MWITERKRTNHSNLKWLSNIYACTILCRLVPKWRECLLVPDQPETGRWKTTVRTRPRANVVEDPTIIEPRTNENRAFQQRWHGPSTRSSWLRSTPGGTPPRSEDGLKKFIKSPIISTGRHQSWWRYGDDGDRNRTKKCEKCEIRVKKSQQWSFWQRGTEQGNEGPNKLQCHRPD